MLKTKGPRVKQTTKAFSVYRGQTDCTMIHEPDLSTRDARGGLALVSIQGTPVSVGWIPKNMQATPTPSLEIYPTSPRIDDRKSVFAGLARLAFKRCSGTQKFPTFSPGDSPPTSRPYNDEGARVLTACCRMQGQFEGERCSMLVCATRQTSSTSASVHRSR